MKIQKFFYTLKYNLIFGVPKFPIYYFENLPDILSNLEIKR